MQKKKVTVLQKVTAFAVGVLLALGQTVGVVSVSASELDGESQVAEKIYYEDTLFHGFGTMVCADYNVVCDEARTLAVEGITAPSYGNSDPSMTNSCGAITGTNVIVFNDRFFPNLIPNFEPGLTDSD